MVRLRIESSTNCSLTLVEVEVFMLKIQRKNYLKLIWDFIAVAETILVTEVCCPVVCNLGLVVLLVTLHMGGGTTEGRL